MPIYEYRCDRGHRFEVFESMHEDPLTECVECSASCERVLSAPAVHFKGSGFYTTDYARKGAKQAAGDGGGDSADSAKKSEKSDKGSSESGASKSSESAKPSSA